MRTLVLSDLHSNLEATRACLAAAQRAGYDRAVVLGDLVGYGGSPEEVVAEVLSLRPAAIIRGNHDRVVAGIDSGSEFNFLALQAALGNRRLLTPARLEFLARLPSGPLPLDSELWMAHGSPRDEDEYLVGATEVAEVFEEYPFRLCLFGHTHIPCVFSVRGKAITGRFPAPGGTEIDLKEGERYLINPGSVGQPRDEDPRAAFLILDESRGKARFHRIEYPIQEAQARILEAGLPPLLARRLEQGV